MIHLLHMVMTPDLAGKMPGQHVNETTFRFSYSPFALAHDTPS